MFTFESGVLDRTRLVSNILMIVLLAGNIYFSVNYWSDLQAEKSKLQTDDSMRYKAAHLLNLYIDKVLSTQGTISFDDRVMLENDVRQMKDADVLKKWEAFVNSKAGAEAQQAAVKLMSTLTTKML